MDSVSGEASLLAYGQLPSTVSLHDLSSVYRELVSSLVSLPLPTRILDLLD